jgi:hypothetical protein
VLTCEDGEADLTRLEVDVGVGDARSEPDRRGAVRIVGGDGNLEMPQATWFDEE